MTAAPVSYDKRSYLRELALYCLHHASTPATAGELAEHMGTLAQSEGHPKELWIEVSPSSVFGCLKGLQNQGDAMRVDERKNTRSGRAEPTWTCTGQRDASMPLPNPAEFEVTAEGDAAVAAAPGGIVDVPADPYESLSREQLLAVLRVSDDVGGAVARFMRDLDELRARATRILQSVGLD